MLLASMGPRRLSVTALTSRSIAGIVLALFAPACGSNAPRDGSTPLVDGRGADREPVSDAALADAAASDALPVTDAETPDAAMADSGPTPADAGPVTPPSACTGGPAGSGMVYHVGPGQMFTTIGAVPWFRLAGGDTVCSSTCTCTRRPSSSTRSMLTPTASVAPCMP